MSIFTIHSFAVGLARTVRVIAEREEENPADNADPMLLLRNEIGNECNAKHRDDAIYHIRCRRAEAGHKTVPFAVCKRASDAENADRSDRRSKGETYCEAFEKIDEFHREYSTIKAVAIRIATTRSEVPENPGKKIEYLRRRDTVRESEGKWCLIMVAYRSKCTIM